MEPELTPDEVNAFVRLWRSLTLLLVIALAVILAPCLVYVVAFLLAR